MIEWWKHTEVLERVLKTYNFSQSDRHDLCHLWACLRLEAERELAQKEREERERMAQAARAVSPHERLTLNGLA